MKIILRNFENNIEFIDGYVNILEITNQNILKKILISFLQIQDGELPIESIKFYSNGSAIELYNKVSCYYNLLELDLNLRKNITLLHNQIEKELNEDNEFIMEFRNNIETMITKILVNTDIIGLSYNTETKISDYLKFKKLEYNNNVSILEKIIKMLDIEANGLKRELIIIYNLKTFLEPVEIKCVYKHVLALGLKVLFIESFEYEKILEYEKKLIIDENFDEYSFSYYEKMI